MTSDRLHLFPEVEIGKYIVENVSSEYKGLGWFYLFPSFGFRRKNKYFFEVDFGWLFMYYRFEITNKKFYEI